MASRTGGADRISTKAKLATELLILGKALAQARERRGFKQSDIAAKLGLPASHLSKVENGTRRLDVIEFVQIAAAMEIDPGQLMTEVAEALEAGR